MFTYDTLEGYRATLARLPDDIVLAIATRLSPEGMDDGNTCVCGWVIREAIAREVLAPAEDQNALRVDIRENCQQRFGGTWDDWSSVFLGVCADANQSIVEEALMDRIMEAALRA